MIPGAGWASVGPGYRHWYGKDFAFVDASASISVNNYRLAQARVELPSFSRAACARHAVRWQDFGRVDYFGAGLATHRRTAARSTASSPRSWRRYATLRPFRWMDIGAQIGWTNPVVNHVEGPFGPRPEQHDVRADRGVARPSTRATFRGHPTSGVVLRGAGARYDDRTTGAHTFKRYEGEAAGFLPIAGGRVVLALHGWMSCTGHARRRHSVPFYLQPSLGGVSTLRSFTDYRFRDDNMLRRQRRIAAGADDAPRSRGVRRCRQRRRASGAISTSRSDPMAPASGFTRAAKPSRWSTPRTATRAGAFLFRLKDPLGFARINRQSSDRAVRAVEDH